jgi:hypothetical protein
MRGEESPQVRRRAGLVIEVAGHTRLAQQLGGEGRFLAERAQ